MKKHIKVNTPDSSFLVNAKNLSNDNNAWVDLILSKTALIIASAVILAAAYSLAVSSSDMVKKNELEVITLDLVSNIDSVGTIHSDTDNVAKLYTLDTSARQLIDGGGLNISVTGEYVSCTFTDDIHHLSSVRPLSYKTLPFSPIKLRSVLTEKFAADGNISQPVYSIFPYTDVTDFLDIIATEELYLNTAKEVHIEKASVFVTDGTEVKELEYILVYQ